MPRTPPQPPKGKAVDDEDPNYSPMDDEGLPMTVRGEDGRVHKLDELAGTQPPHRDDDDEKPALPSSLRGNPD